MPDLLEKPTMETPFASPEVAREESGLEADERAYEQSAESKEHFLEEAMEDAPTSPIRKPQTAISEVKPVVRTRKVDAVTVQVEKILEEGLGELYATLPEEARPLFKKKGEEASDQIADMLRTFKVEASRVIRLIRDWLLVIPKANKYFLEQEAKIKTDAVLEYAAGRNQERAKRP